MEPILPRQITIRPILGYLTVVILVGLFVWYVFFQARFIISGPKIELSTQDGVSSERVVEIEGQVSNIVQITLNGRVIYTDERGYFKEAVVLENGYTIATLRAKDRYGRSTTVSRSFVYKPEVPFNQTDNS